MLTIADSDFLWHIIYSPYQTLVSFLGIFIMFLSLLWLWVYRHQHLKIYFFLITLGLLLSIFTTMYSSINNTTGFIQRNNEDSYFVAKISSQFKLKQIGKLFIMPNVFEHLTVDGLILEDISLTKDNSPYSKNKIFTLKAKIKPNQVKNLSDHPRLNLVY